MSLQQMMSFPGGSDDKESSCKAGDPGSVPGLGRTSGEGNEYLFQYSCLENSMTEEPGRTQASLVAQMVKNLPAMQAIWLNPQVGKIPRKREW